MIFRYEIKYYLDNVRNEKCGFISGEHYADATERLINFYGTDIIEMKLINIEHFSGWNYIIEDENILNLYEKEGFGLV